MKTEEKPLPTPSAAKTEKKKKKSHTGLIVTLCVLLALAAGGGGTYAYMNYQTDSEAEERAYRDLDLSYDSSDYRSFLERYPRSPHAADVEERMRKLQVMERDWAYIERSNRKDDFVAFKNKYQNPLYDRRCDQKIDSLDWTAARLDDSLEAYRHYMTLHPDGQYYTEAAEACKEAESQEVSPEEEIEVRDAISGFFDAFGRNEAEDIRMFIAPRMGRFLNNTNVNSDDVIATIHKMFNEHIHSCRFAPTAMTIEKETDEDSREPTFHVSGIVQQDIDRDDDGRRHGTYRFNAEMNRACKLTSLTLTRQEDSRPEP